MRRILILETGLGYGGSTVSLIRLLSSLDRRRFVPTILLNGKRASRKLLESVDVQVVHLPRPFDHFFRNLALRPPISYPAYLLELAMCVVPQTVQLAYVIKSRHIDIVHLNNHLGAQLAGIFAARLCGVPCVVHMRNVRKLRRSERLVARWVDRFLVLSQSGRRAYLDQGIPAERIDVLYDPVLDVGNVDGKIPTRQSLGIPLDVPAIGILSRLVAGKGHEDFLRAAAHVRRRFPQARFLVVGKDDTADGSVPERLRRLVKELALEDRVIFTGWRSDIPKIISSLDVVVDASTLREGTRLTILESMAMGKPVIATDVGAESEFFSHGEGGLLVSPGNPDELGKAVVTLLNDPKYAKRMAETGRRRVLSLCNPRQSASRLEEVYEKVGEIP